MPRKTHAACFVVTGEYLTQQARSFVLEDEPGRAYRLLSALDGEGSEGVSGPILRGEMKLEGDSSEGITTEEDDDREYREQVAQLYAGRFRRSGKWYRPCGIVKQWGRADAHWAAKQVGGGAPSQGLRAFGKWAMLRSQYYAPVGGFAERVDGEDYLFEVCSEPPPWFTPCFDAGGAVASFVAAGRVIPEVLAEEGRQLSYSSRARITVRDNELKKDEADELLEAAYAAEEEAYETQCKVIGERVREQAGDNIFEMLIGERAVKVPRAPFMHWAFKRSGLDIKLPPWTPISPSGMKLQGDDPYHTDWLLGAGLELADAYDKELQEACFEELSRLQFAAMDAQEASEAHES